MSFGGSSNTPLSQEDFVALAKELAGKSVNFSTRERSFKGTLETIHHKEKGVVCVTLEAPESRKRLTADPWVRHDEKYLIVSLSERDKIWCTHNDSRVYVSFLSTCTMTIG